MKSHRYMPLGLLVVMALGACQSSTPVVTPTTDPAFAELQAQADQAAANKEIMQQFLGLFSTGAWDDFDQVIATDCVLHYPGGADIVGLDAMVAAWQDFFPKLQDMKVSTQAEVTEGDRIMEFLTFEATYVGDYMGQQIAGMPIKYNQVEMQRIADGKIVEWWVENDRLWMAQQIGMELVPAKP
jgi:predicted ester cyclase